MSDLLISSAGALQAGVLALLAIGLALAVAARELTRRAAGLVIAFTAAALLMLVAGLAPTTAAIAVALGVLFGAMGFALAVRLREAYGDDDLAAADAADDNQDRAESGG